MTIIRFIRSVFSTLDAAVEVSAAVDAHRMPKASALNRLGIPRDAFAAIRL